MNNLKISRELFTHINVDSASLSAMVAVIHKFDQPGQYEGLVMLGHLSHQFAIVVKMQQEASSNPSSSQTSIDLKDTSGSYTIQAGSHVLFYTSAKSGYTVEVYRSEKGTRAKVFDSRELTDGDLLAVTVIRPGIYTITNAVNNAKAELVVGYPELVEGKTHRKLPPVSVECAAQEISPGNIRVEPGQGLVFTCKVPTRIKIDLLHAEDRPSSVCRSRIQAAKRSVGETAKKMPSGIVRKYRIMPRSGN